MRQRLGTIRTAAGADNPDRDRFWERRRAVHLLTQKVHCGVCGGVMSNIGRDYVACSAARKQGVCSNTRGIRRGELDHLILDALRTRMMDPTLSDEFSRAFIEEWNRALAQSSSGHDEAMRELAKVERKLKGLIDALADGFRAAGLQDQLAALEARRLELTTKLSATPPAQPRLHPSLPQAYRAKMAQLQEALEVGPENRGALEAVRSLIERIVLHPLSERGFEIEILGDIALMIRLGQTAESGQTPIESSADHALFARSVKVVAGTGFEPVTFRL